MINLIGQKTALDRPSNASACQDELEKESRRTRKGFFRVLLEFVSGSLALVDSKENGPSSTRNGVQRLPRGARNRFEKDSKGKCCGQTASWKNQALGVLRCESPKARANSLVFPYGRTQNDTTSSRLVSRNDEAESSRIPKPSLIAHTIPKGQWGCWSGEEQSKRG